LRIAPLPAYAHLERDGYVAHIAKAVADKEAELSAKRKEEGKGVLGRRGVLQQSPFDRPKTHEPRRELNPRVATPNKWARIEALFRLKAFVERYKEAWVRWKAGERDVLFPHGTYQLCRYAGVQCVGPP
jgi:hypothetical protein